MDRKPNIQNEVELTLNSLDGVRRAEASPFLYTRLMARLESAEASIWSRWAALLAKPAVSVAILMVFLLINGYLVFTSLREQEENIQQDYVTQQISYFESNQITP